MNCPSSQPATTQITVAQCSACGSTPQRVSVLTNCIVKISYLGKFLTPPHPAEV
jgi:hypothetical protein